MASSFQPSVFEIAALVVFVLALAHVFLASRFERMATRFPRHAGLLHLLGEVEVVFGFWAMILVGIDALVRGGAQAVAHLEGLHFTEPLFVFAVMVVAGCRPVLHAAIRSVELLSRAVPLPGSLPFALVVLGVAPLLGSFITEPAAMTVAALLLRDRLFVEGTSAKFRYAALGTLFVNVSIGGVLTSYAAPPVLMVARAWNWDTAFMLATFGWRAVLAVAVNAALFAIVFRRELSGLPQGAASQRRTLPATIVVAHLALLAGVVVFAHHVVLFIGVLLLFLGFVQAYRRHHDGLLLREGLLVGFFLAGLVVLGNPQAWWLQPLVGSLDGMPLYVGTAGLTAVVDNAAITYLGSLLPATSESFRYHLVAGAVVGGGLTLIANAPNPAGASLLRERFAGGAIQPLGLLAGAAVPTLVALVAFGI